LVRHERDAASPWLVHAPGRHSGGYKFTGDWIARDNRSVGIGAEHDLGTASWPKLLTFDATELGRWDSALIAFLWELRILAARRSIALDDSALPVAARRLLALTQNAEMSAPRKSSRQSLLARIGQDTSGVLAETVAVADLLGSIILRTGVALRGRAKLRGVDMVNCMRDAGAAALPIVTIVNFLIGAILAFVGAVQLRRFGAGIFVANLVGIAVVREMAAVMTAIVMAGRTGGAYAAEIATMQGNEEIDALRAVGIPVQDYLIVPRIVALTTMMPILYLYGCAVGLLGGFVVSIAMLSLTPDGFMTQTISALAGTQFLIGITKSVAFGALVAFTGCRMGLRAGRSAADVGRASTQAVVIGIVGVILVDAVFAICTNALGI
jgi:phospholipid/cholesterol/gamma-HCH transport system permease protein